MSAPRLWFLSFLTALPALLLNAQTEDVRPFHGCHFAKNQAFRAALSGVDRNVACGSNARSDSLDILNYAVTLDLTAFGQATITAACEISFTAKQDGIEALPLDLLDLTVDSVTYNAVPLAFDYNDTLLNILLPAPLNIGDTMEVVVHYHGHPYAQTSGSGFGGFYFENAYAYNLGINLDGTPYNFGRAWHPCFDNFVERATYDFNIITNGGKKGYAVGTFLGEMDLGNGKILRQYRMTQELPTYLVGVAASNYVEVHQTHTGAYGDRPILLVGKSSDLGDMNSAFAYLGDAIDVLEAWYGPYIWGQVGYVMTTRGAMEHSSLIAFPDFVINNGPDEGMNRLMAHELAHHWWGNITTLSCPSDMWIKEGNAEYGAHLFTELAFGKAAFIEQVKANHYDILRSAHTDDGGNFLPLSGIPYEWTYGTHTYYKGADMMHNLRGYLGDSLFQKGMRSILDKYAYQAVDASLFRDQLTAETGVDMTSFFNDWIFSPGFAAYEIDSMHLEPGGGEWAATVFIQQKLRKAPHFHTNTPLSITFFDKNWNTFTATVMASGEYSTVEVNVPFEPVWQILNDDNRLNLSQMQNRKNVYAPGDVSIGQVEMTNLEVLETADSAMLSIVHYWGAADPYPDSNLVKVSRNHYWRVGGILPDGFMAKARVVYRGSSVFGLDYDLTHNTEDSLILLWRPHPGADWIHYPYYRKLAGIPTDGNGTVNIDTMLPGDYAFANGDLPEVTHTNEPHALKTAAIFPNPSNGFLMVNAFLPSDGSARLTLYDAVGKLVKQESAQTIARLLQHRMETSGLPPGLYWLKIEDDSGSPWRTEKVVIL